MREYVNNIYSYINILTGFPASTNIANYLQNSLLTLLSDMFVTNYWTFDITQRYSFTS